RIARGVDQMAVGVGDEIARTREVGRAVGVGDDEEAAAIDREVGGGCGVLEDAVLGDGVPGRGGDAAGVVVAGRAGDDQRGELGSGPLVARGGGIGDVVCGG